MRLSTTKKRLLFSLGVVAIPVWFVMMAVEFNLISSSINGSFHLPSSYYDLHGRGSSVEDRKVASQPPVSRFLSEFRQRFPPKQQRHPLLPRVPVVRQADDPKVVLQGPIHQVQVRSQTGKVQIDVYNRKAEFSLRDYRLPPLESILAENNTVIGDPQPLLHYAIIGFGKCGTSSMQQWLAQHPQIQSLQSEIWALVGMQPWRLIRRLHKKLKDPQKMRGYKCPGDIHQPHVIGYYRQYWPQTKLFVGIRHPIRWFESLYNFRIQNFETYTKMLHPNKLIGGCFASAQMVCTVKGDFAYKLLLLGKQHWNGTRPSTELEKELTGPRYGREDRLDPETEVPYTPNEIFLFEVTQLSDADSTRQEAFRQAVQDFLGLDSPLQLDRMDHVTPGMKWSAQVQAEKDALKIDICERQYIPLRRELMYQARINARWIRESFLDLPGVHVANREHFETVILESHMKDPCGPESDLVSQDESDAIFEETRKLWRIHDEEENEEENTEEENQEDNQVIMNEAEEESR